MEALGKLIGCDRCGKTVFLKTTGEKELDDGWTRYATFESPPDGWSYYSDVGRLCPQCSGAYQDIMKRFMDNIEVI